jgi:hypothetical protein
MMQFIPDAARVVQRGVLHDGRLPPRLLALTGYGTVAAQHRKMSRAHGVAISPRKLREFC